MLLSVNYIVEPWISCLLFVPHFLGNTRIRSRFPSRCSFRKSTIHREWWEFRYQQHPHRLLVDHVCIETVELVPPPRYPQAQTKIHCHHTQRFHHLLRMLTIQNTFVIWFRFTAWAQVYDSNIIWNLYLRLFVSGYWKRHLVNEHVRSR